ncbi:hypothetical protein V6Z11_A04G023300 [Gossypium hirsutum]
MGRVIRKTREDICFLQETKLESVSIESVRKLWRDNSFDFKVSPAMEKSEGLLSIWDKNSFVRDSGMCEQRFIVVAGKWALEGMEAVLINIYAPNSSTDQRILWDEIIGLRNQFNSAWIIGGDFNVIRNRSERRNYKSNEEGSKEFGEFIDKCKLIDLSLVGGKFTWFGLGCKRSRLIDF